MVPWTGLIFFLASFQSIYFNFRSFPKVLINIKLWWILNTFKSFLKSKAFQRQILFVLRCIFTITITPRFQSLQPFSIINNCSRFNESILILQYKVFFLIINSWFNNVSYLYIFHLFLYQYFIWHCFIFFNCHLRFWFLQMGFFVIV